MYFVFLFLWELNEFRIVFVTNVSLQRKRIKTRKCDFYIRERSAALCAVCIDTFLHVFRSQLAHFDSLYIFGDLLPCGVVAVLWLLSQVLIFGTGEPQCVQIIDGHIDFNYRVFEVVSQSSFCLFARCVVPEDFLLFNHLALLVQAIICRQRDDPGTPLDILAFIYAAFTVFTLCH